METNEPRPTPDFDREFERFTRVWLRKYSDKYNGDIARMEALIPDLYVRWLNTPAPWLDGQMPGLYFARVTDPAELIDWAADYALADKSMPAPMSDRIIQLDGAEDALVDALAAVGTPYTLRLMVVALLTELQSTKPMGLYIKWIASRAQTLSGHRHSSREDDLAELCAESLLRMGSMIVEPILAVVPSANAAGQETFLDILCNFPGDERIVSLGLDLFERRHDSTALIAAYLGKLGDPRALPPLERALHSRALSYLDYIEVRNAVEELGGSVPSDEPDFAGDPGYESLKMIDNL